MAALQELVKTSQEFVETVHAFECDDALPELPNDIATHLYWIIREALNNAAKHAEADHIVVQLVREDDDLVLRIQDDGQGVPERLRDEKREERETGMGLRIMRHRANLIGAIFDIEPTPGGGTTIKCTLPLGSLSPPPE